MLDGGYAPHAISQVRHAIHAMKRYAVLTLSGLVQRFKVVMFSNFALLPDVIAREIDVIPIWIREISSIDIEK
jgi:hypothetical protein